MSLDSKRLNAKRASQAIRISCCVVFVTAVLSFLSQVNAQSVDPLVEEGVQILIAKQEILHLQKTGQIDREKAQERLRANKQRWDDYKQNTAQWPKAKQEAFVEQLKNRYAIVFPPIQQKWNADALRVQEASRAQSGDSSKEIKTGLPQASAQSVDPLVEEGVRIRIEQQEIIHLQRTGQISREKAQERSQAVQSHIKDFGERLARLPRAQQQPLAQQIRNRYAIVFPPLQQKWNADAHRLQEEGRAQTASRPKAIETDALTTSNVDKDVQRATQISLAMKRNQMRRGAGVLNYAQEDQENAPLKAELENIQAKYATGGPLAASARDFNGRVDDLVLKGVREKTAQWDREARAEYAAKQPKVVAQPVPGQAAPPEKAPTGKDSTVNNIGSLFATLVSAFLTVVPILAFVGLLTVISYVGYRRQPAGGAKIDSYTLFALGYLKRYWGRILFAGIVLLNAKSIMAAIGSFLAALGPLFAFVGSLLAFAGILVLFSYVAYRKQPAEAAKIDSYKLFALGYLKKKWWKVLCAAAVWFIAEYNLGYMWGAIALAVVYGLSKVGTSNKQKRENAAFKKQIDKEQRHWCESLGATHAERVKTINEMFDHKDKTLDSSTLYEMDAVWGTHASPYQWLRFKISRNLAAMEPREREFLRVVELIQSFFHNSDIKEKFGYNWAKRGLIWGDGKASISDLSGLVVDQDGKGIRHHDNSTWVKWYMEVAETSVDRAVDYILGWLESALKKEQSPEIAQMLKSINQRLKGGSQWLAAEDVAGTIFAPKGDHALQIGLLDDTGHTLSYSGEGSLISIAPPGSGKTQCNVFPNLLTWRGPAVVLDVKGEIYAQTSKWRAENVGPVYKFSPLDPAKSHCYNPLSFIRQETDYIWEDSRFLADMMIVPSGATDPFWENKARDVLTAAIAYVCYSNTPDHRPMSRITDIIHGGKPWDEMVLGLQTAVDVRSMMQQGSSLATMNEKTRDSVLQTAQSSLSAWSGERISRVTQKSDWSPLDLRSGKNPTIYICLKPAEVESYTSLLRVFIAQHIRMLTSELPPHGAAPILFLLDELPRLKHMPPVEEAIEIGRQYGLRLWMFAQSLGQLEKAYPNAEGMVGSCAVRIFMNPSSHDGTAEKLSEELGYRESALDGSRLKVVEAAELTGPEYKDYQIVMAASSKPVKVKKAFAWQDAELKSRMGSL